jgi:hypothetical protein
LSTGYLPRLVCPRPEFATDGVKSTLAPVQTQLIIKSIFYVLIKSKIRQKKFTEKLRFVALSLADILFD